MKSRTRREANIRNILAGDAQRVHEEMAKKEKSMETITEAHINAITRNLVEFGYAVTPENVKAEIAKLRANKPVGIIGMFAKDMLIKAGLLEERR